MRGERAALGGGWRPCCSPWRRAAAARDRCGSASSSTASAGYRTMADGELAAAELPLIARGAQPPGGGPAMASAGGRAAGRRLKIVRGCSESGEFSTLIGGGAPARRARARRCRRGGRDGLPGRASVARTRAALSAGALRGRRRWPARSNAPAARAPTFTGSRPTMGRVSPGWRPTPPSAGWRTVTVLPDAAYPGWNAESAFVREFCALGGRVERRRLPIPARGRTSS